MGVVVDIAMDIVVGVAVGIAIQDVAVGIITSLVM